jgi:hypothetical protein
MPSGGDVFAACRIDTTGRTLISSCGSYAGGNYYLNGNLTAAGTCISVTSGTFDLALQGYEIVYGTTPSNFTNVDSDGATITVGTASEQLLPRPNGTALTDGSMATVTDISNTITCSDGVKTRGVDYRLAVDGYNGNPTGFMWIQKPAQGVTCTIPSYTYTYPRFGIFNGISDSYTRATGNVYGGGNGMVISCGKITPSVNAPAFNMPVWVSNHSAPTIRNMVLNCRGWSAPGFGLSYVPGAVIQNNTINCDSSNSALFNRMAFEGYAGWNRNYQASAASIFSGNTITNGVQGGILAFQDNSEIYGNTIQTKSRYTNDFAINAYRSGIAVYNNTINNYDPSDDSVSGRGIYVSSSNEVYGNTIKVHGAANNQEYGGCQAGGTYGIQTENGTQNANIHDNQVFAYTRTCAARGLRITTIGAGLTVTNDVVRAIRHDGSSTGRAIALSAREANGLMVIGATLEADSWIVEDESQTTANTPSQVIYRNVIFKKGTNPAADFHTWSMQNYSQPAGTTATHTCIDCIAQNGASLTDVTGHSITTYWKPYQIFIKWTYTVNVTSGGSPVIGATVTLTDALSNAHQGTTDASGNASIEVPQYRFYNTAGTAVNTENRNPYSLSVVKSGCTTATENVGNITATGYTDVPLTCI